MNRTRRATLAALLVALIVAAGFALIGLPNVELVTLLVFISGFLLGPRLGMIVGAVSWGVFSTLNPMGAAVPPILAAQLVGGALIGVVGGTVGPLLGACSSRLAGMFFSGVVGLVLTAFFEVLVNAAAFFVFTDVMDGDSAFRAFWAFIAGAAAFTLMHLVWNTAVFLVSLRPLMAVLDRYRRELH